MPKENIDDTVTKGFRAEVSWRADPDMGWVQLATTNQNSPYRMPTDGDDTAGPLPASLERDPNTGERFDGWHVTLDRDGINRLVRALRRARDQAFGADA